MSQQVNGQKLHAKAMQGESLTEEEQVALEQWYAQQDAEESRLLQANTSNSLANLRQEVNDALIELQQTTEHVRLLMAENAVMQRELDMLKRQLAQKTLSSAA